MYAAEPEVSIKSFDKLLENLVEENWISCVSADRCQKQNRKLIVDKGIIEKCKKFDLVESRLDEFFMDVSNTDNVNLREVVKLCLILSHGNARVEFRFLNKYCRRIWQSYQ